MYMIVEMHVTAVLLSSCCVALNSHCLRDPRMAPTDHIRLPSSRPAFPLSCESPEAAGTS